MVLSVVFVLEKDEKWSEDRWGEYFGESWWVRNNWASSARTAGNYLENSGMWELAQEGLEEGNIFLESARKCWEFPAPVPAPLNSFRRNLQRVSADKWALGVWKRQKNGTKSEGLWAGELFGISGVSHLAGVCWDTFWEGWVGTELIFKAPGWKGKAQIKNCWCSWWF